MGSQCCHDDPSQGVEITAAYASTDEGASAVAKKRVEAAILNAQKYEAAEAAKKEAETAEVVKQKAAATGTARKETETEEVTKRDAELSEFPTKVIEAAQATRRVAEAADAAKDKPEAAEAAAATKKTIWAEECEFNIILCKERLDTPWGLRLLQSSDGDQLVLGSTTGQAMSEWQKSNPAKQVQTGDEIISLNGTSGDAETLLAIIRGNNVLDMVLRRQLKFTVEITGSTTLGVAVDSRTSTVTAIYRDSPVSHYNGSAKPNVVIFKGDELCGVNGVTRETHNLHDELTSFKEGDKVQLIFKRPAIDNT